jgi:hypothetical protein
MHSPTGWEGPAEYSEFREDAVDGLLRAPTSRSCELNPPCTQLTMQSRWQFWNWNSNCSYDRVTNRTEPRTVAQRIRYLAVDVIALFLVWWMMRVYVL